MRKAWSKIPREIDQEKERELQGMPLEKGDVPAMLLAAFGTLFLPVVLILLALCGAVYFLFILL